MPLISKQEFISWAKQFQHTKGFIKIVERLQHTPEQLAKLKATLSPRLTPKKHQK